MKHDRKLLSFHHRLDQKILEAGLSYRELSQRIGRGETYIATMVRNRNDPGLSTVVEICDVLSIPVSELTDDGASQMAVPVSVPGEDIDELTSALISVVADRARNALTNEGQNPTLDDVIEWWHENGGRLENFERFREKVDLFEVPGEEAKIPVPVHLGHESLLAQKFNLHDEDHLQKILPQFDTERSQSILDAHKDAASGKPVLSIEQIDVDIPVIKSPVHAKYKRLLLPVNDSRGNRLVLNYAKHIR